MTFLPAWRIIKSGRPSRKRIKLGKKKKRPKAPKSQHTDVTHKWSAIKDMNDVANQLWTMAKTGKLNATFGDDAGQWRDLYNLAYEETVEGKSDIEAAKDMLSIYLNKHMKSWKEGNLNSEEVTIGDFLEVDTSPRNVKYEEKMGPSSLSHIMGILTPSLVDFGKPAQTTPISDSDTNRGESRKAWQYIKNKLSKGNIERKFANNFLGPNKDVYVNMFGASAGSHLPDGVAKALIGLLKGGSHFGEMKMNKYGRYIRGPDKAKYEAEREEEFPKRPHKDEPLNLKVGRGRRRWANKPTEEDKEKYGWQQHLEATPPSLNDDYDWTISSVVKGGPSTGPPNENFKKGKYYVNFIMIYYGNEPVFWAGIDVQWDMYAEPEVKAQMKPFLKKEILDWRKW